MVSSYRPEIDGLRALAVIPVILFHAGFDIFNGGFVGVDIFFVISGYLITTILMSEMGEGNFSVINFYERRARRILPPLYVLIIFITPVIFYVYPPHGVKDYFQSVVSTVTFLSNYFFYFELDYFNDITHTSPLVHTWSLSIEEQFYFLFPALLLISRKFSINFRASLFALFVLLGFCYSIYSSTVNSSLSYFNFFTRFWEILFGAVLSIIMVNTNIVKHSRSMGKFLSVFGLMLIVLTMILVNDSDPYPNYYTAFVVAGTGLLIVSVNNKNPDWFIYSVLTNKYIVYLGLLSYSLYLWHQPIFAIYREASLAEISIYSFIALSILCIVVSFLSFRYVEAPFRNRSIVSRRRLFSLFCIASISLVVLGYYGHKTNGFIDAKYSLLSDSQKSLLVDVDKLKKERTNYWEKYLSQKALSFSTDKVKILILGDSKSEDLYVSFSIEPRFNDKFEFTQMRWDDSCMDSLDKSFESLSKDCAHETKLLIESGLVEGSDLIIVSNTWTYLTNQNAVRGIRYIASRKPTYVISTANFNDLSSLVYQAAQQGIADVDRFFYKNIRQDWQRQTEDLASHVIDIDGVTYIEKLDFFCDLDKKECDMTDPLLIWDSGHLTYKGAMKVGKEFYDKYAEYMFVNVQKFASDATFNNLSK